MQVEKPSLEELKNREVTRQIVANLALEGMEVPKEMLADLELLNCGKITKKEFLDRGIARAKDMNNGK